MALMVVGCPGRDQRVDPPAQRGEARRVEQRSRGGGRSGRWRDPLTGEAEGAREPVSDGWSGETSDRHPSPSIHPLAEITASLSSSQPARGSPHQLYHRVPPPFPRSPTSASTDPRWASSTSSFSSSSPQSSPSFVLCFPALLGHRCLSTSPALYGACSCYIADSSALDPHYPPNPDRRHFPGHLHCPALGLSRPLPGNVHAQGPQPRRHA